MRDLISKLDAIVSETELRDKDDLTAKKQALDDLEADPIAGKDPEISAAIDQRRADLEREAKAKGFSESFEIGDAFGISFSEDHEIATEIVDILEDGIVIELDDAAMEMLTNEGLTFLEGEIVTEEKQKGVDGKACWKGYKRMGTKQKGGKTVDNCVKMGEDLGESGLQRYTGIKKYGKDGFEALQKAGREGADEEEKGRIKDKYLKKEDHGPENPDAPVNYGEYDREGDMAKDQLRTIDDAAEELYSILDANENLPEWVQKKITLAVDYIDTARDYMKSNKYAEGVAEGSAHGYNVARYYEKYNDQKKITNWLRKNAGLDKTAPVYFDDADLVFGDQTIVPDALVNPKYKMSDLLAAVKQAATSEGVNEAEYQGRKVQLGKKMAGDVKKSKVYVRKPNGNIVKVNFGDKKMRIKKSNPARRKSFRARHNCKNPGPRWKARYWSCRSW
jgi:hypothetical protein